MNALDVAVVGAGVGGLAAALALSRLGHRVTVFERAPALGEVGAGITMTPNACKALRALGAYDPVAMRALKPLATRYRRFDSGEVVTSVAFGDAFEARYGAPLLTIHRAGLLDALVQTVAAAGAIEIRTGYELTACGTREDRAWATFANGESVEADVLIGADGVRSTVRAQLHGPDAPTFSGHVAFRATVPTARLSAAHHTPDTCVWVGGGQHVVQYAINQGARMNAVIIAERDAWIDEGWGTPASVDEVRDEFAGWHPEFTELLDACDDGSLIKWGLFSRTPQRPWRVGRATLLGDAVHPAVPFMAQGGAQALEDAVILARALESAATVEGGLDRYERTRFERTAWVSAKSLFFGELFHAVAAQSQIRDERQAADEALYSYDPAKVPLAPWPGTPS